MRTHIKTRRATLIRHARKCARYVCVAGLRRYFVIILSSTGQIELANKMYKDIEKVVPRRGVE